LSKVGGKNGGPGLKYTANNVKWGKKTPRKIGRGGGGGGGRWGRGQSKTSAGKDRWKDLTQESRKSSKRKREGEGGKRVRHKPGLEDRDCMRRSGSEKRGEKKWKKRSGGGGKSEGPKGSKITKSHRILRRRTGGFRFTGKGKRFQRAREREPGVGLKLKQGR